MTKEEMIAAIKQMTVLELAELVKALEQEFGVSAAAPVAMAMAPGAATAAAAAPEEEQIEWDVILKDVGAKKIQVIKVVRTLRADLGLKEAKELVDGAPATVLTAVTKEVAADAKSKLEAEGAVIEVK
jgi:large subunit ribosomal protein L7/L12